MGLSKDLVAASSTPLILSILNKGESYGYGIIQQVHDMSDGDISWADGMLYPILHRLEKKEWIESFWGKAETGRKRKYYRLCKAGLDELKLQRKQWKQLSNMISQLEG
ncbi:helix-turn-helix transcriptional regulator [Paraglaciecola sp.]|uniref:PadR family transcriptional regulator n=1 Tax=Paraglaciecola sp. TaxID=1920173 RepID=UPI00326528BE